MGGKRTKTERQNRLAKSSISSNSKHEDPQENTNNDYYILDSPGLGGTFCDILNFD